MLTTGTPPPSTLASIGAINPFADTSDVEYPGDLIDPDGFRTAWTWTVPPLVLRAVTAHGDDALQPFLDRRVDDEWFLHVWPPQVKPVAWPPRRTFHQRDHLALFTSLWKPENRAYGPLAPPPA